MTLAMGSFTQLLRRRVVSCSGCTSRLFWLCHSFHVACFVWQAQRRLAKILGVGMLRGKALQRIARRARLASKSWGIGFLRFVGRYVGGLMLCGRIVKAN